MKLHPYMTLQKAVVVSPPDYFLCGVAKSSVYKNKPKTIDELKGEITNYVHSITWETLHKVFENKRKRVELCLQEQGHHFQHLL